MARFKLVLFDFDGTLADSAPWFIQTLGALSHVHGFKTPTASEVEYLRGKPNREIIKFLGVRFWQMPAIARDMRQRSAEAAHEISLFSGIDPLLHALQASGLPIAIVSSNSEDTIRRILGPSARLIEHYVCGVSLFGKAGKFRSLARKLGVPPAEVLAIGDEVRDVEAAKRAGFASASVTWGYANRTALETAGPDYLIDTIEDLEALLGLAERV